MKKLIGGGLAALAIGGALSSGLTACSTTGGRATNTVATYPSSLGPRTTVPPVPVVLRPTVAPAGSVVRDGQFEFRVARIERLKTVGDPDFNWVSQTTAQGEFVVVTMQVTNIGSVPATYFSTIQKLILPNGQQVATETMADAYVNKEIGGIVATVNPGNWIWGRVAFDVPVGTELGHLALHDSFLSGGVTVKVV